MTEVHPGTLLLATPALVDPNFSDAVVLILDVSDGAVGVVLNRPSGVPIADVLAPWADVVSEPEVLFRGGPVQTDGALAVGLVTGDAAQVESAIGAGIRPVVDALVLVDLDTPTDALPNHLLEVRIFAGYAGWGDGQLEREIEEGSWYVVAGRADDVFGADTATLWRDVLRRQPGDLAWHSTRPVDSDLN
ncbi:YqgE/AlgH family protein [Nocardioides sp. R-C-SC26]|uniref:YqgE/AlgH family protein n=1 Tax=Nocardioides sp. R-C-SC26 TaxID=2870414 RepID=UPI001E424F04|nr:YqgE/AlgH family protein [Nocardioides sp. R-C-SC26]